MRLGIWTPLPHSIRSEARMEQAIRELGSHETGPDGDTGFRFASDIICKADALGFDITLVAARQLGPDLEAWVLASALAAMTSRIEIMVAVHPGLFPPPLVAKMGATLDRISGGRFSANIVTGWWQEEFEIYGNDGWLADPAARYRRMDEFVQVIQGLWTQDRFSLDGEFFAMKEARLPTKCLRQPPIYTATRAEAGLDVVARYCDHWFVPQTGDFRAFDDLCARLRGVMAQMDTRSARFGRTIQYAIDAHVICDSSQAAAERVAEQVMDNAKGGHLDAIPSYGLGTGLVGTPDLIIERLQRLRALGIGCAMLHFHPMMDGLDTFVAEVLPHLDWRAPSRRRLEGASAHGAASLTA